MAPSTRLDVSTKRNATLARCGRWKALENIACMSQLYANFNILRWFPPLSVSWSRWSFSNKPVIDHVPLLWVAQTSKRVTQANHQIRKGQLKRNMIHLPLSHVLLYLCHPLFPSLRLLLCPLFMNSPCLARRPTEKFLVCSLSQGQSLVRKPIELWSNSSP